MRHGKYRFIIGFLAVPVALYAVLVISPFVQDFQISLTDWSGLTPEKHYIGFDNYQKIIHNNLFWKALWHNILMLLIVPIVTLALGLFFAFMLNVGGRRKGSASVAGVRGAGFYKIVYFFPQVLSVTVIAVLWQQIYNPDPDDGLLNSLLGHVGLTSLQQSWLGDPSIALACIMAVMVWANVGFYVVLFSAGMASIPAEIYEAVLLDGANRITTFFRITLPLLRDTVATGWVYMGIIAMDGFAFVQLMSVNNGGPNEVTDVVPLLLYKTAFRDNSQYGMAAAMGVAMLIVTLVFAVLTLRLSRRERIEF
ncbi:carbohydrate ABC transporter permease [Actinacidiphila guanduensis]|jgi:N-acetylglucosamine transport system permease protein|uniref:N-acetylglucosamine transport system permease protein n=1 Tax=Actinacidiphila guanduensis TaxID=310781 RepID=A0A1H0KGK0_9ACTN|nr:sugar ABC transporter permease [Actinacidiphila guanduensis]SDO55108.1 N-acetylglucosamine transport system permease protein [Actinacidiphila guanduensis]